MYLYYYYYYYYYQYYRRHAVTQLIKHCTTSRKVAGSIPDGVIAIFH